jgi:hypothetical protein
MGAKGHKAAGEDATFTIKVKQVKAGSTYKLEILKTTDGTTSAIKTLQGTWKDAKETKDGVPIEISGGTATVVWKAEGPPADGNARAWRVFAQVTVEDDAGKKREQRSQELEVYNDWVEVTAVCDDGKAGKDAGFKVLVNKRPLEDKKGRTGDDGKKKIEKLPPGKVTLEWEKPYKLDKLLEEKATSLKAQLVPAKRARLITHKGTSASKPFKQWVNLPADAKLIAQGSKAKVQLKLEDGKKGDKLFVKHSFTDGNSKRNDVKLGIVGAKTETWADKGGLVVEVDDKGLATVEVELGKAGGDLVVLEAGGTERCKDIPPVFLQAWRKLWFQLTAPAGLTLPSLDAMKNALRQACIEYEQAEAVTINEADADMPANVWFDSSLFGARAGQRYLVVGGGNAGKFHTRYYKKPKDGQKKVHVLLCHAYMEPNESYETVKLDVDLKSSILMQGQYHVGLPVEGKLFRKHLKTGAEAIRTNSQWREIGGEKKGDIAWEDLRVFAEPDGKGWFRVPAAAHEHVAKGGTVRVVLYIDTHKPSAQGAARKDEGTGERMHIIAMLGPAGPISAKAVNILLTHELGHSLQQAAHGTVAPGLKLANHPATYENDGWHCAHPLQDTLAAEKFKELKAGDASGLKNQTACTCVMYGQLLDTLKPGQNVEFCVKCLPFIRAQEADLA